jgi:hypothetical protein
MEGNGRAKVGRRALLAAGAAGVAAAAAQAVAPAGVIAVDGDIIRVGQVFDGSATTVVHAKTHAFEGRSDTGDGLRGETNAAGKSGVYGYSKHSDGYGVYGSNIPSGNAAYLGSKDHGVFGSNPGGDTSGFLGGKGQGVRGSAHGAEGVRGESGTNNGVVGMTQGAGKSGVYGYNTNADGYGVHGHNDATMTHGYLGRKDNAVYGASPVANKAAVLGEHSDPTGVAVAGTNTATQVQGGLGAWGMGLFGSAPVNLASAALYVGGRAMFERAGLLTIAKGTSSISTNVAAIGAGGPMPTMVLATLQTNRAGVYIQAAVLNPVASKVTIYLNKKVSAATKVAFFVLN